MASQYAEEQKDFYNDCQEDGGPIQILRPKSKQIDLTDPSSDNIDPSQWAGDDQEPEVTETFALLFPSGSSVNPFNQALIPSYNLDFEITPGMLIKDAMGVVSQISTVDELKPDGRLVIFYTCNLESIPDRL